MNHNDTVKQSFKKQAEKFGAYHMSKVEYTDYLINRIGAKGTEHALEVAAGTCICGRALSPFVKDITCLDLTEEMLAQAKKLAAESQIKNIYFQTGNAEELPYDSETFDLVVTRLSFHHFDNPEKPFSEMKRVLKKGGKLVVWDMEAVEESLRKINDKIENMRDPSHTRILSREEFEEMFKKDFLLQCEETTLVPVNLKSWMELTGTPENVQKEITNLMKAELTGGSKTGFSPYNKESQIMFDHRWLLLIGEKN
jgi:ubiquinone/menaquinone biosynthesis C-methylase UbiE